MSNTEVAPEEVLCGDDDPCAGVEVLEPRDVPLGGPRAMDVRRTLPQRQRSLIGAWCFLDHYGPDDVGATGGMRVPRHPHTGLQTVSWLFTGQIEHRDSAGFHAIVRPGELNLMTAGRGISHSEFSTPDTAVLHGAQLWVALPDRARQMEPTFEHYRPVPLTGDGWAMRVFLGSLSGSVSPVTTHTPLLGAEIMLEAGSELALDIDPSFEHGLLVDTGTLTLDGHPVATNQLAYLPVGRPRLTLAAGADPLRVLLIGGEPLEEQIVMWWNFVGRSHEEIVEYRARWQSEIGAEHPADEAGTPQRRFGTFPAGQPAALPAPVLPNVRMRPRTQTTRRPDDQEDAMSEITIHGNPDRNRFEVRNGDTVIGHAEYQDRDGGKPQRIFTHTVIDEEFGGQGLAGRLAAHALSETVAAGLAIVPVCPYIKAYLDKHPELAEHVVAPTPEILQFLSRPRPQ